MRLAFCLFKYYPYGGLERDFLRIAKICLSHGHSVHVYTMKWEGEIPDNFSLTLIPVSAWTNDGRAKQFSEKLNIILKKNNFDIVIGFNRLPGLDVYFAADPCYQTEIKKKHGAWYRLLPRYKTYLALEKAVFSPSSATKILLLNPSHQKDFSDCYHTPASRFELLPVGIGKDRKRPAHQTELRNALRKKLKISPQEKIILLVGSNFKLKGVDRALHALASLPTGLRNQTHLWIVGKGNNTSMEKLTHKLAIRSNTLFWGLQENIIDFYAAADCLIHPARLETAGMVLIEAIESGLPIIVTENCGYATYIHEAKAGEILPSPFKQEKLNKTLYQLLCDENKLTKYKNNALTYAATHDLFHLSEHAVEIIEHAKQS